MADHRSPLSFRRFRAAAGGLGRRSRSHLGSAVLGVGVLCCCSLPAVLLPLLQQLPQSFLPAPGGPAKTQLQQQQQQQLQQQLQGPGLEAAAALSTAVAVLAAPAGAHAAGAESATSSEGLGLVPFVAAGVLVLAAFAAVLSLSGDAESSGVDDKKVVTEYFNNEGFERWNKIYGETEDVNPVQKDIRVGHAETVSKILQWLDAASIKGKRICDAGCGTGNLSIPLASRGAMVSGSDISSAMVTEAAKRAEASLSSEVPMPSFETRDLEKIEGEFDTVCCVDVLIHYPPERLEAMVGNLARLSKGQLILSFAPKTWYYVALKRLGELFPGKSKTTRAYLHEEETVERALHAAGFKVTRREMTSTNFYFSRLFEAQPVTTSAA